MWEPDELPADSAKAYTYVERMPIYPGGGGAKALTADLLREFRAVSAVASCATPNFPIYVTLTVGPSGTVYDVKSINNQPLPVNTNELKGADGRGQTRSNRSLQQLPAACEQALVTACQKLPRFKPGTQNNRRVAVTLIMRLN